MNKIGTLVIFDHSGTLSLDAPQFGQPERLGKALTESGLAAFGLADPNYFWEKIANPTWEEGSTTAIGYQRLLTRRVTALGLARGTTEGELAVAAGRFVTDYLAHSRIDPRWREPLARLSAKPAVRTIIATDHYAEATAAITEDLSTLGLRCAVANSADLGAEKGDRRFWEKMKAHLGLDATRRVIIVDDFGHNEAPGDAYAQAGEVAARQERTLAVLGEVFPGSVTAIPFFLTASSDKQEEDTGQLIAATTARIEILLREAPSFPADCRPLIVYPCPWGYKVIGRDREGLAKAVAEVLAGCHYIVTPSHTSKGGTYHCLNVETTVESEPQRQDLCERLRHHPAVKMVL
ncbi:MAG: DUF493 domain-containing protein [Syntrophaceae bacterium]|nr:DUF493 domain-containing protein [Syntrophaceae bacterium]